MSNQSIDLFVEACGATAPLQVSLEHPAWQTALRREFRPPFLVAGREAQADLILDDRAVSRQHAYIQMIAGHTFCLDLGSRRGVFWDGRPRHSGWLGLNQAVDIGPFSIRLPDDECAATAAPHDWDPLASHSLGLDALPPVSLEVFSGGQKKIPWRMNRVLALVGKSPGCKVRMKSPAVSRFHCSLLRTPLGLFVVDLLGRDGISVNGSRVRWSRLDEGDELQVGELLLCARYHSVSGPFTSPALPSQQASLSSAREAPGTTEEDRLRDEQAKVGETEQLRRQVAALERALAEAGAAGQQTRDEERRHLQEELDEARHQADQNCQIAHAEAQALRREVEAVRQKLEHALAETAAVRDHLAQEAKALRQEREQTERLRGQVVAIERALAEAAAARDDLTRAGQEARARHEAKMRAAEERARTEERLDWQRQLDDARRQADQELRTANAEAERLRQEAETWRQEEKERKRLHDKQVTTTAEAERLRGQVAALERALAEAAVARDDLKRADQEARARHETELRAAEERGHAEERCDWQGQLDEVRRQTGQELQAVHTEADRLRQEAETLQGERERMDYERARAVADAERLRCQVAALDRALAEAVAARDDLRRAGQEARARHETEVRTAEERARAEERRDWQRQLDDARRRAGQELEAARIEAERLRQEAETRRQEEKERERLHSEQSTSTAEAERLRGQVVALESALAEAAAARDGLTRAVQEARARHEAEGQARADERHQWQGQLDDARRQAGQEAEAMRQEQEKAEQLFEKVKTLERALAEAGAARGSLARAEQEDHAQHDAETLAWAEERHQWQGQLDDARRQASQELQAVNAEREQLCQEAETLRREREMLLAQLDALTQQREPLTAREDALGTSYQEAEHRFQTAVIRFGTLVEQIQSLREEFQRNQQSHKRRWSEVWSRMWTRPAPQPEPWEEAIFRRLETLRKEATDQQRQAMEASAEVVRAENERQMAEARRRFQQTVEHADHLTADVSG